MKKYFLLLLLIAINRSVWSQSRLIGVMPMQFNPSFAGSAGGPRIALLTGYDYAERKNVEEYYNKKIGSYVGYPPFRLNKPLLASSYDNFIPKLSCGIGFYASWKNEDIEYKIFGTSRYKFEGLKSGFVLSPKISIKGKWTISPSIGINYKHLTYVQNTAADFKISRSYDVFYGTAGILINTENFFIGYSYNFYPINKSVNPRIFYEDYQYSRGIINVNEPQDRILVGYRFQRRENSKTSYSVQANLPINFYKKERLHNPDLSLTFRYKKFLLGANLFSQSTFYDYEKEVNVAGFIGYQTKRFKIMYSQNILKLSSRFYSELSIRFNLPRKKGSNMPNFD